MQSEIFQTLACLEIIKICGIDITRLKLRDRLLDLFQAVYNSSARRKYLNSIPRDWMLTCPAMFGNVWQRQFIN